MALTLYLVGLALAFGIRTCVQLRRTGTSGFRGISGRPRSLTWWGGVLFPTALLLGLAAPVLVLTGTTPPLGTLAHPVVAAAGLVVGVVGLLVVLLAQHAMGASWRIGVDDSERTELVTPGLFGWVRNPIFTGMVAVSAGVALMAPTLIAALAVACLIAAVHPGPLRRRTASDAEPRRALPVLRHLGRAIPARHRPTSRQTARRCSLSEALRSNPGPPTDPQIVSEWRAARRLPHPIRDPGSLVYGAWNSHCKGRQPRIPAGRTLYCWLDSSQPPRPGTVAAATSPPDSTPRPPVFPTANGRAP